MAWTEQQSEAITTRDCGLIVSAAATCSYPLRRAAEKLLFW